MVPLDVRRVLVPTLVALLLCGCRTGTPSTASESVPIEEPDRFPHALHTQTQCTECHAIASVLKGERAIPGADDHAPCDREQCHQTQFLSAP